MTMHIVWAISVLLSIWLAMAGFHLSNLYVKDREREEGPKEWHILVFFILMPLLALPLPAILLVWAENTFR